GLCIMAPLCENDFFIIAVHFWAPTFKWGISIANIADFAKPPEKLSYPQEIANILCYPAVTCTRVIWSHYSTVITPVSWFLSYLAWVYEETEFYN
ncbi:hypothetical protein IFM89_031796, partial [Coptis chinensis]